MLSDKASLEIGAMDEGGYCAEHTRMLETLHGGTVSSLLPHIIIAWLTEGHSQALRYLLANVDPQGGRSFPLRALS